MTFNLDSNVLNNTSTIPSSRGCISVSFFTGDIGTDYACVKPWTHSRSGVLSSTTSTASSIFTSASSAASVISTILIVEGPVAAAYCLPALLGTMFPHT